MTTSATSSSSSSQQCWEAEEEEEQQHHSSPMNSSSTDPETPAQLSSSSYSSTSNLSTGQLEKLKKIQEMAEDNLIRLSTVDTKVDRIIRDVSSLQTQAKEQETEIIGIKQRTDALEDRTGAVEARTEAVEARTGKLAARTGVLEDRMNRTSDLLVMLGTVGLVVPAIVCVTARPMSSSAQWFWGGIFCTSAAALVIGKNAK